MYVCVLANYVCSCVSHQIGSLLYGSRFYRDVEELQANAIILYSYMELQIGLCWVNFLVELCSVVVILLIFVVLLGLFVCFGYYFFFLRGFVDRTHLHSLTN